MTKVVAEIGINHGGNFNKAITMIQEAKRCGAHAVKFQYYLTEMLCANRNVYDSATVKVLEKNRMHPGWLPLLKAECDRLHIEFACTAFCKFSAEEIAPYVKSFKVASPEVCDLKFIKQLANYGMPLILSTGKADYAMLDKIKGSIGNDVTLLYCVSQYPAMDEDYKMEELSRLQNRYGYCWRIGLSDHTQGLITVKAALGEGIDMVEKHFKVDNNCVDAAVSIMPNEMTQLCTLVKDWNKYR